MTQNRYFINLDLQTYTDINEGLKQTIKDQ